MADSSHLGTPLGRQNRNTVLPTWSNASSSDLTAVGRNSQEKGQLGSPLLLQREDDEERLLPLDLPTRRRPTWVQKFVRISGLVFLVLLVHILLDGEQCLSKLKDGRTKLTRGLNVLIQHCKGRTKPSGIAVR